MTAAVKASKLFVPPYPPRSDRPRGALSMILTLRRNPLEIWGKADFERPLAIGRSILGLRAAQRTIRPRCAASFSTTPPTIARTSCSCEF